MAWLGEKSLVAAREICSFQRAELEDYAPLSQFHYRPMRFVGVTQVWTASCRHRTPIDAKLEPEAPETVVGGLVVTKPEAYGRARDRALDFRYSHLERAERQGVVEKEFRCISRVTVHPTFRGNGIAVGLVRLALEEHERRYMETFAMFARFNDLFDRAGMRRLEVEVPEQDVRLQAAFESVGQDIMALGDLGEFGLWLEEAVNAQDRFLRDEVRRWWRTEGGSSRERGRGRPVAKILETAVRQIRQRPIYYLWDSTVEG